MQKKYLYFVIVALFVLSCKSNGTQTAEPKTDVAVGTAFIRHLLDAELDKAAPYILPDSANQNLFSTYKRMVEKLPPQELENFKKANILVDSVKKEPGDTTAIFYYANSYKKDKKQQLKLVWLNNTWKVDLVYAFNHH
jgi:hypothetical protein